MKPPETHPYRLGIKGRSCRTVEQGAVIATLTCHCGRADDIRFRQLCGQVDMDRKFLQRGWRLDPARCPEHARKQRGDKEVAEKMTPVAMRAQIQMVQLLTDHFDVGTGTYAKGWSDQKIADETKLSVNAVREYRVAGFGDLKEPEELVKLATDLVTMTTMIEESIAPLRVEMNALKDRLEAIRKKYQA